VSYYAWSGHEHHANTTETARAMALLYALTGSFDQCGGNVLFPAVPTPAAVPAAGSYAAPGTPVEGAPAAYAAPGAPVGDSSKAARNGFIFSILQLSLYVPGAVIGLALLLTYTFTYHAVSMWGLVLAMAVGTFPLMLTPIVVALKDLPPEFEEALWSNCSLRGGWRAPDWMSSRKSRCRKRIPSGRIRRSR